MSKKRYKSKVLKAVHESASDLHELGLIDAKTMREFDSSCLKKEYNFSKGVRGKFYRPDIELHLPPNQS